MSDWLDLEEAAKICGCTAPTLRKLLNSKQISGRQAKWKSRKVWQINKADIPAIAARFKKTVISSEYETLLKKWQHEQRTGYHSGNPLKESTIERNCFGLKAMWKAIGANPSVEKITVEGIRTAISSVSPSRPATRENIYKSALSFYKLLVRENIRPTSDLNLFKEFSPKPNKTPRRTYLAQGDFERLIADNRSNINGRNAYDILFVETIAKFLRYTGVRRSELINVNLQDIDWRLKIISVNVTKTGEPRKVGLHPELAAQLKLYLEKRPKTTSKRLVVQESGRDLTKEVLNHRIKAMGDRAGIPITPHGIRRSFITDLLGQSVALSKVKKIVGHKHLSTTDLYDMTDDEDTFDVLRGGQIKRETPKEVSL